MYYVHTASGQPSVSLDSTTSTSITLSWTVPNGSVVNSFDVIWRSTQCPGAEIYGNANVTGVSVGYTAAGLRSGTEYFINVIALNEAGFSTSGTVFETTDESGTYNIPQ